MASVEWTAESLIRAAKERQDVIRGQIRQAEKTLAELRKEERKLELIINSAPDPEQEDEAFPEKDWTPT